MTQTFCDKCKKELIDTFDKQEMHTILIHGGYASVFGDGTRVRIELCQECLHKILDDAGLLTDKTMVDPQW